MSRLKFDAGDAKLSLPFLYITLTDEQILQLLDVAREKGFLFNKLAAKARISSHEFFHILQYRKLQLDQLITLQKLLGIELVSSQDISDGIDLMASHLKSELC